MRHVAFCICLLLGRSVFAEETPVQAQTPPAPASAPAVEKIDMVETIETPVVADAEAEADASSNAPKNSSELIAHFHPAVIHFPIGFMVLCVLYEGQRLLSRCLKKRCEAKKQSTATPEDNSQHETHHFRTSLWILTFAVLSFAPALLTGWFNILTAPSQDAADLAPALLHRNLMFASFALAVLALVARVRVRSNDKLYWALLLLATGIMLYSGHLGGKMVYGDDFLPF